MKKILFITAILGIFSNSYAQETVTNRSGKEITVNAPATTTTQGQLKLAGDLGGTADAPTIPSLTYKLEGSGTINYIPKFTAEKTLGNSLLFDDGTNVGIGTNIPLSKFSNAPNTTNFVSSNNSIQSASGVTWLTSTNGYNTSLYNSNTGAGANGLQVKVASSSSSTMAFEVGQNTTLINTSSPLFNVLGNGNVGIGLNTPVTKLQVQGIPATDAINADAQILRLSRPTTSGVKWDNIAQFNLGAYAIEPTGKAAKTRLDLAMNDGSSTSTSNIMTWQANGNVGVGTTAPTAQLEVATTNSSSAIIRRASNTNYTSANLILQKTFSTDPLVSTAVGSGDYIGRILFSASNGTANYPTNGPDIVGFAYGTQTATTNGGGIIFRTVKDATSTVAERIRIEHNGNVGIGVTSPVTAAAILDVKSTSSGVLIPRMTTTERTAITVAASLDALLVYDTDVKMFYYYNAATTSWTPINVGTVNTQSGTTYILSATDNGRVLDFTSATAVTLTVPSTLPVGFQVSITQAGAGQVTFVGSGGITINNRYSATKTSGQWAKAGLEIRVSGASGSAVLSGDVQ